MTALERERPAEYLRRTLGRHGLHIRTDVIIEEAVTLDQLSNGRLDLGVGRGVSPAELAFHGVSGEEEAQGRFDEAFAILQQGLTSDSVTFDGKYHKLLDAPVISRPVQRPHPPLWYGTRTPAKAQWCARLGMPMMALVP
jgi:alkanesulfonate monooxygenase SsuD/methylene tetrahydromethanopterin reductase-like flavin-dependent oxidoreductase (luciferase family)